MASINFALPRRSGENAATKIRKVWELAQSAPYGKRLSCPPIDSSARAQYEVQVTMRNEAGAIVATSVLRSLVGPQR